jgi:hypothetical protein
VTSVTGEQDLQALRRGEAALTEEALDRVMQQVGVVREARAWATELSFDVSRHFAWYCLGTDNPLWTNLDYASSVAPNGCALVAPMVEYVAASADSRMGGVGLPGLFALHASDSWKVHKRLEIGARVHATINLADVQVKESKWGGRAVWQTREFLFYDDDGDLVSEYRPVSIRAERKAARGRQQEDVRPYVYSDEEIAEIEEAYDAEVIRGADVRYVEDVAVGDSLHHVVKGPLTVMDLMCWWIGAGGPYIQAFKQRHLIQQRHPSLAIRDADTNVPRSPEDAHIDIDYARRSGVALPFDIGRQRSASLFHLGSNWAGDRGHVVELTTKLRGRNYVGDTTWYRGTVIATQPDAGLVECSVWGENQRGIRHTEGTMSVQLPRRTSVGRSDGVN